MRVISLILADKEVARVEEGRFNQIVETKGRFAPNFAEWYDACFFGIANSETFDERFERVRENNYFCFKKPALKLIARNIDE